MRQLALIPLCWAVVLAGCGSGGADMPDLFVGGYWKVDLTAVVRTYDYDPVGRVWGRCTSDGAGGLAVVAYLPTPEMFEVSGAYTLGDDHRLGVTIGAWREEGGLDALGRCAVTHHLRSGGLVGLSVLLARSGAFDDGTLAGTWHLAGAGRPPGSQRAFHTLSRSRLTLDGAGGYTATPVTVSERGWLYEEDAAPGLTYQVAPDGELEMVDHTGSNHLHGGVLAGGEVAVAIGGEDLYEDTVLYAFVRTSSGQSEPTLYGNYWVAAIQRTADGFLSVFGTLTADGGGTCWFAGQECLNGEVGTADAYEGADVVASDGALTLTVGDGATLVGGVSRDGQFFTAAGGTTEGDAPHFLVAVAQQYGVTR